MRSYSRGGLLRGLLKGDNSRTGNSIKLYEGVHEHKLYSNDLRGNAANTLKFINN